MNLQRLILLFTIFSTALATPLTNSDAEAALSSPLDSRACKYNGCHCQSSPYLKKTGGYCAGCPVAGFPGVQMVWDYGTGGSIGDVYECNTNGDCCNYGAATDCKGGKAGRCGVA